MDRLRQLLGALVVGLGLAVAAPFAQAAPIPASLQQAIDQAAGNPTALAALVAADVAKDPGEAGAIVSAAVKANPGAVVQIAVAAAKAAPGKAAIILLAAISSLPFDEREAQIDAIVAAVKAAVPQAAEQIALLMRDINHRPYQFAFLFYQSLIYAPVPASPR